MYQDLTGIRIFARANSGSGSPTEIADATPCVVGCFEKGGTVKQDIYGKLYCTSVTRIPVVRFGMIEWDPLNTDEMSNVQLVNVFTHAVGHVLGFGTLWGQISGLELVNSSTTNPLYIGQEGINGYIEEGGNPGGIPVGCPWRNHWRESVFLDEIMTSDLSGSVESPISLMTIGSFKDLGFSVNELRTGLLYFETVSE